MCCCSRISRAARSEGLRRDEPRLVVRTLLEELVAGPPLAPVQRHIGLEHISRELAEPMQPLDRGVERPAVGRLTDAEQLGSFAVEALLFGDELPQQRSGSPLHERGSSGSMDQAGERPSLLHPALGPDEAHVTRQRVVEAETHRGTVDGGDHRDRATTNRSQDRVDVLVDPAPHLVGGRVRRQRGELLEVAAGAERADPGEDHADGRRRPACSIASPTSRVSPGPSALRFSGQFMETTTIPSSRCSTSTPNEPSSTVPRRSRAACPLGRAHGVRSTGSLGWS